MADQMLVKRINRARVMNAIRIHSPVPRAEIARLTSLDRKSITNVVGELVDQGIVVEVGKRKTEKGRPLTLLEFDRRARLVLGICLAETKVVGTLVNLYGQPSGTVEKRFPFDGTPTQILEAIEAVYRAVKQTADGRIAAVGISLPGIIDLSDGLVHRSVNIRRLEGVNIKHAAGKFIEEPISLEEGSRSKALAEKWFGMAREVATFVCVDLGVGIGAGFVQDRRLYVSDTAPVGEIGHIIVDRRGRPCRCGHRGCLEAYLSEVVILEEINQAAGTTFEGLDEIDHVDGSVRRVLRSAGRRLGFALSYVVNMICPPLVVINGPLVNKRLRQVVMPEVQRGLEEGTLPECLGKTRIVPSEIDHAAALGAAARVMSDLFEVEGHFYV